MPPQYFVEVFADVDGDVTVQAPSWGTCTHQPSPEVPGRVLFFNAVRVPRV